MSKTKELKEYIDRVVKGILAKYDGRDNFKKYIGINYKDIEKIIIDRYGDYSLITTDIYGYYEQDISVETAIEQLHNIYDRYAQGTASVM